MEAEDVTASLTKFGAPDFLDAAGHDDIIIQIQEATYIGEYAGHVESSAVRGGGEIESATSTTLTAPCPRHIASSNVKTLALELIVGQPGLKWSNQMPATYVIL